MITSAEQDYIEDHAYVPEHIPHYVTAISQTEPFLFGDFLTYVKKDHLIFVGYPLHGDFEEKQMGKILKDLIKRFKPKDVALTAPAISSSLNGCVHTSTDHYYRLDLSVLFMSQKLRNMIRRANRELYVGKIKNFDEDHKMMVNSFLNAHPVDEATQFIFKNIPDYISWSNNAWVFDARNKNGELVAFDVVEFGARQYAFYMFNFRSETLYIPGASDLLLSEVIQLAKAEGKKYINLGLGINPGVIFFKKKWGGILFLPYTFCLYKPPKLETLDTLFQKL